MTNVTRTNALAGVLLLAAFVISAGTLGWFFGISPASSGLLVAFLVVRGYPAPQLARPLGAPCPLCEDPAQPWHRLFIISPAGWGSLMGCTPANRATMPAVTVASFEEITMLRTPCPPEGERR